MVVFLIGLKYLGIYIVGPTNGVNYNGIGLFGSNFIGPGSDVDPNTLGLKPLDLIDYAVFQHDMAYFRAKASGVDGALNNNDVRNADKKLVSDALTIMNRDLNGKIDPFTKQKISMKTYKMAEMVAYAFGAIDISNIYSNQS